MDRNKALGYRRDARDDRDYVATKTLAQASPIQTSCPRLDMWTETIDQGQIGSCTANATAQAIRVAELQQIVSSGVTLDKAKAATPFLSRLFAYFFARACDHDTQHDGGAQIRNVFRSINTLGFPPESEWSYTSDFRAMPSAEAMRAAFDQRLTAEATKSDVVSYERIASTGASRINDVMRAISMGRLVVFGTDVSHAFCSDMTANGGKEMKPPADTDIAGGHAMCFGGYNASGVDVLNSWGHDFGQSGWLRMSWDYVTWARTSDLWIVERAPIYSTEKIA